MILAETKDGKNCSSKNYEVRKSRCLLTKIIFLDSGNSLYLRAFQKVIIIFIYISKFDIC